MRIRQTVLCTGGAGFIGGHTAIQLANSGFHVVIVDNFANSTPGAVDAIKALSPPGSITFEELDVAFETERLKILLKEMKVDGLIHFAALKSVGDSVTMPILYYRNNLNCMLNTIEACLAAGVKAFVFSSSATVYQPAETLLDESQPLGPSNPYGQTKFFGEQIMKDVAAANPSMKMCALRYFNPIGAHPSGTFGEDCSKASNLMPAIQRAIFKGAELNVFGDDWPTPDGTGVRDYVHVMDIADMHIAALDHIFNNADTVDDFEIFNLGTGRGYSVLEIIDSFSTASGKDIKYNIVGRRPGDLGRVVADPTKAKDVLNVQTKRTLYEACVDGWAWMSSHPEGHL